MRVCEILHHFLGFKMSTSVTVKDYDTFEQGIADVRSDASASNWYVV